jgi:VanZ family protein
MTDSRVNRNKERRDTILRYAPLVIWIGVILFLGSGQGSMTRTSIIIRPILEFLFPSADELTLQLYHGYIRKLAHFTEYGVLAFLALRAFTGYATRYVAALVLVALIASIDEFNQSFEASRTSSVWDVLLDITGGLFVTAVCYFQQRRSLKR